MQEYKKYINVHKKEYENDFDEMTGGDVDYRLSNKEEKKYYMKIQLSKLTINQEFANIVNKNKDLLMVFDGKSSYPSAMADKDSYYPRIDTGIHSLQKKKWN